MSDENKVCIFADMKKTSYIHALFIAVCLVALCVFSSCGNKSQEQTEATIDTIESGKMTKDLALITTLENVTVLNSENFIKAIRETLEKAL